MNMFYVERNASRGLKMEFEKAGLAHGDRMYLHSSKIEKYSF